MPSDRPLRIRQPSSQGFGSARVLLVCVVLSAVLPLSAFAGGWVEPPLDLSTVVGGLSDIVAITHAGDDRLFLSDKGGLVWIWDGATVLSAPFLDVSALAGFSLEQGLLSVAFHPDYGSNGFVYIFYSDNDENAVIARYTRSAGDANQVDPTSGVILLEIDHFGGHYGGQLQFGPDGYLYFALGDGGQQQDPSCRAQNLALYQGKMMRIDVDQSVGAPPYHGIPGDNPFVGGGDPADEVWAVGFRNPWRFSFDRLTGDLYISDVGQFTREEVSFQPAGDPGGQNYGWKLMEGTFCHDPDPIDNDCPAGTPSCFDPSFTDPVLEYDHSQGDCSITGGYVYRGHRLPSAMYGRYLFGDWCTGTLRAGARDGGGAWSTDTLTPSLSGITTFGEGIDGELLLTDGSTLYRLETPGGLFFDGFESGNLAGWSSASP
ncbi:MAG: PQQ-dependent sugar dehydrogenase [Acidobacteriota bacterium]